MNNKKLLGKRIKELISALQDYSINNDDKFQNKIYIQFLEKLGFYPNKKISNYMNCISPFWLFGLIISKLVESSYSLL